MSAFEGMTKEELRCTNCNSPIKINGRNKVCPVCGYTECKNCG